VRRSALTAETITRPTRKRTVKEATAGVRVNRDDMVTYSFVETRQTGRRLSGGSLNLPTAYRIGVDERKYITIKTV
jgi:hypothetical protein